jgi:hypothetical protein
VTTTTSSIAAAALAIGLARVNVAGPEWEEMADAGALPGNAQPIVGPAATRVERIRGSIAGAGAALGGDFQDMFLVFIDDPLAFSATVDVTTGFNTELWLLTSAGLGRLGNDECAGSAPLSCFGNMADDGTGATITAPGLYLLAISGFNSNPGSLGGLIFDQIIPTEVSGPDGSGGSLMISSWIPPTGAIGSYAIDLTGCIFIACPGDVDLDGDVDFADLLLVMAAWGPCVGCDEDLDHDGAVGFGDLLIVLGNWGPCT